MVIWTSEAIISGASLVLPAIVILWLVPFWLGPLFDWFNRR